jgi:hypothetical protein
MANKSKSKTAELYAATYKSSRRWESNRRAKLEKQFKLQPTNEQVRLALKDINYRRKTPKVREWSADWIRVAKLFKEFCGRFDREIMSSNTKVAGAALQRSGPVGDAPAAKFSNSAEKNWFSIGARSNMRGSN